MCGICGILRHDGRPVDPAVVRGMMDLLRHRGPNDEGEFHEDGVGLGHLRLSIIDLSSAGRQPMFSADERQVLVFNGEVYNYLELREELAAKGHVFRTKTDSEVLLAAYREWGAGCLERFNGMFAFAVYDRTDRSLFCARDRFGIKPLYTLETDELFAFASEIPPLLALQPHSPEADDRAVFDYLAFNRTDQDEHTFFRDVRKVQHGTTITVREGSVRRTRWYNLRERVGETSLAPEEWRERFFHSLRLRLRSDVPVGVCLSGGIDSSSIVSSLTRNFGLGELHTFSAVYGEGVTGDESAFIETLRPFLRNMHFTRPDGDTLFEDIPRFVRALGEPVPSTSPYAQFKVMELAREHVVVTLDGQGADEELAGYHYFFGFLFKELLRKGKLDRLAVEVTSYLRNHRSLLGLKTLLFFLLPGSMRTRNRVKTRAYLHPDFIARGGARSSLAGDLYGSPSLRDALLDHFEYKLEHLLKWEDRNSMAFSLEARVPFLDHELVEDTLSLPRRSYIDHGTTKKILREAMRGILPEPVRQRRDKIGFLTPEAEWFRGPRFREYLFDLLRSPEFASRGLFDPAVCLDRYRAHLARKLNISREIWKWIHLETWYREFIDR